MVLRKGHTLELRIKIQYYHAYVEKDFDRFITLDKEDILNLQSQNLYAYFQLFEALF